MILPASYANGFAPRDAAPLYPELWKGCVGAWNMGLGPTGNTLRDWSGFGNHGTLTNGPTWQASQGRYAISFDGTDDYVTIGNGSFYTLDPMTVSFWLKCNETPGIFMCPVWNSTRPTDAWNLGWGFFFQNSTTLRFFKGAWNSNIIDLTIANPSSWNHITASVISTTLKVYLNGVQATENTNGGSLSTGQGLTIGEGSSSTYNLAANLDGLMIHNRALSPNEIRLLASRRGIAYEMQDFNRVKQLVTTSSRYNIFSGSVGSNEIIGVA